MTSILYMADGVIDHNGDPAGDTVLVEDNIIKRVGTGSTFPSYPTRRRLNGYILPAFVDAHLHIGGTGLALTGADLRDANTPEEVARRLSSVEGPLAYGRGWDQERFPDPEKFPTRRLLDKYVPNRPAIAVRVCGHMAVVNTRALQETMPWQEYPELVDRSKGLLYEDAVYYTLQRLLSPERMAPLVEKAIQALGEAGIGGFATMSCTSIELRALKNLEAEGKLFMPTACYPDHTSWSKPPFLEGLVGVVGVKLYADGSFGAHTAALREPYTDRPDTEGILLLDSDKIAEITSQALAGNLRVAVHAIGDKAINEVLTGLEKAGTTPGKARIEHFSIPDKHHIDKASQLGVHLVVQPYFRIADWWLPKLIGPERSSRAYPLRSLYQATGRLAFSTDSPVDPYEPWHTFNAAIGKCTTPLCTPDESLDWRSALQAYTVKAAEAAGGPVAGIGRIEPGAPAQLSQTPEPPGPNGWQGPARLLHTVRGVYK